MRTMNMSKWICYAVGYVFLTSGVLKLVVSDFKATFMSLGLPFPETMLFLVAITEIACSAFIISRLYVRQAAAPLILIMLGAIFLTKLPILMNQGFLQFAFDARLDIIMLILLLLLWQHRPTKQL
ncbi:DoxX family protein [Lentibacillus sp. CBA3610]|uniref:DoxX family protein n=1 Tax=Lentibacillus sp. CBA3610 TaxID=2518176 RepID=UPI001595D224|nr:DoxX family protein [Lentibacillus sp. CBA3610]QKY70803.1 DoxX family protein [Lentibacillus sp. CBA3610]